MTSARLIWLMLIALSVTAILFAWQGRTHLEDSFHKRVPITQATPIESFSRARAGKVVDVPPPALAIEYTVKKGDSWSSIARTHRIEDYNLLAQHFEFVPLKPGMTLTIPPYLLEDP